MEEKQYKRALGFILLRGENVVTVIPEDPPSKNVYFIKLVFLCY